MPRRPGRVEADAIKPIRSGASPSRLPLPPADLKGPTLIPGDALTIEPGLYNQHLGGVRVEDLVVVTETGCENLNHLQQGLDWS